MLDDRLRVLLVEDDPVLSQAIQALLRASDRARVAVSAAASVAEAERVLADDPPDVVLTDLNLSDSQGLATVRRMLAAAGDAAVVVLTGVDDDATALQALRIGAQDYVLKGELGRNALLRTLRHAVERKRAERGVPVIADDAAPYPDLPPDLPVRPAATRARPTFAPGATVAERYRLDRELARGAVGVAFRAEDVVLRRACVLKALLAHEGSEAAARRFLHEARIAASFHHARLVRVTDFGLAGGVPFLVMDLVEGIPLSERIAHEGRLEPPEVARVARDVLDGLAAMHARGVLHRDIKPGNIMLDKDGARIIDFGLASSLDPPTAVGFVPATAGEGTLGYLAPEALTGLPLSPASDLYSVGAIVFEALTGRPYLGAGLGSRAAVERAILEHVPELPADAHAGLGEVALRALEKEPSARFATAEEMRDAILALGLA